MKLDTLLTLGRNITAQVADLRPTVGRTRELKLVSAVLSRRRRNMPVLVGPVGSGRTAILEHLALDMAAGSFKGWNVLEVSMSALCEGETPQTKLEKILVEVRGAGQTILVLDEVHVLFAKAATLPATCGVVRAAILRGDLSIVLVTTPEGLAGPLGKDVDLTRRAVPIEVGPLSAAHLVAVLDRDLAAATKHYGLSVDPQAVRAVPACATKAGVALPGAALDAMDDVLAEARDRRLTIVLPNAVEELARAGRRRTSAGVILPGCVDLSTKTTDPTATLGREKELKQLLRIVARRERNIPIVLGEPGAGRRALTLHLATEIIAGRVRALADHGVVELSIGWFLSAESPQQKLRDALEALERRGKVLVIVHDVARLFASGTALPLTLQELRRALSEGNLRFAFVATPGDHARFLASEETLSARAEAVRLGDLEPAAVEAILWRTRNEVEAWYGVKFDDDAFRAIPWRASAVREQSLAEPGRSAAMLDAAAARVLEAQRDRVRVADLDDPGVLGAQGPDPRSARLDEELNAIVHGQDRAIRTISRRVRLTRLDMDAHPERPDGVFLFVGPSGVGKTMLARTLARVLYTSDDSFVQFDMSEFSESHSVSKLVGSPPGYIGHQDEPRLITQIRNKPHCVLLLDEIEKAHPQVLLLFLQLFDTGRLTDSRGFTADFSRTTVVMTSNLGRELYGDAFTGRRAVGFGPGAPAHAKGPDPEAFRAALLRTLPAEFLGRVSDIVIFDPLDPTTLRLIACQQLEAVRKRIGSHGKDVVIARGVAEALIARGNEPAFGARHLVSNIDALVTAPLVDLLFTPAWKEPGHALVEVVGAEIRVSLVPASVGYVAGLERERVG